MLITLLTKQFSTLKLTENYFINSVLIFNY